MSEAIDLSAPFPPVQDGVSMRLKLIGQMEAWSLNSDNLMPVGRKTRALLAIVALAAPRSVLRSRLAELLWSRRPEEQARASLRQEIHRLLDVLGPIGPDVLSVSRDHLTLSPGAVWLDVDEVLRATPSHPDALALLDGDLLDGLDGLDPAFDGWLLAERERLRDRARQVAESLLREQVSASDAITVASRLLTIDRAHEGAWRALMRAHAERGERGMAVEAYERCRAALADTLDATPSPETTRLLGDIRGGRVVAPGAVVAPKPMEPPPPARSAPARVGARVGILPLQVLGADDAFTQLSVGLAEEITSALSRFRWMFLVSSSSLAQFVRRRPDHETRDEASIRANFGLDLLLDGTVQASGSRLRITLRLMDLRDGNQVVWTRRFDRAAQDLLTLQDEVAAEVAAQMEPQILLIESRRAAQRPQQDATAFDLVLRAMPLIGRLDRPSFSRAGQYLEQALAIEPDNAAAHAWSAYWRLFVFGQGWARDAEQELAAASRHAERAITLDPQDAKGFTIAGHVRAFLQHRLREAASLHEQALALNPNLGMAWCLSGVAHLYMGDWAEAERRLARYKQLSPLDPYAFFFDTGFVLAALMRRDYEGAVMAGRAVSELNPSFSAVCKPYLAALGQLGQMPEAAVVRRRLLAIEPNFSVDRFIAASPFEREQDRTHFAVGLRLAGLS